MHKFLIILSTLLFLPLMQTAINTAHAEQADNLKPLSIKAESQTYDGKKSITVYTGPVHMEKGTMIINASRLEIVDGPNGGKIGTLFGSPGKLVTYRQKRDGGPDLWAEGEAEKIVYDDTLELIKLFNQAKIILMDGKKRTHESSGVFISYDSRTDFMTVNNTLDGVSVPGAGFTNAVIYPMDKKSKPNSKPAPAKSESKKEITNKTGATKIVQED
jgi:lipopolysaccharide export system protein LptA